MWRIPVCISRFIVSWIDNDLFVGCRRAINYANDMFMKEFECNDCRVMKEYVGNILTRLPDHGLKFTQPVLFQSYIDEFDIALDKVWKMPAEPGSILSNEGVALSKKELAYTRSGIGKMMC